MTEVPVIVVVEQMVLLQRVPKSMTIPKQSWRLRLTSSPLQFSMILSGFKSSSDLKKRKKSQDLEAPWKCWETPLRIEILISYDKPSEVRFRRIFEKKCQPNQPEGWFCASKYVDPKVGHFRRSNKRTCKGYRWESHVPDLLGKIWGRICPCIWQGTTEV